MRNREVENAKHSPIADDVPSYKDALQARSFYYSFDSYPYEYDPGVYEDGGTDYYGQGAYDSSEQYADSTVTAAQERLARQGYYRGKIDGIFGPETRRAIMRYQSGHGLRVTGSLNADTLHALGLPRVASN